MTNRKIKYIKRRVTAVLIGTVVIISTVLFTININSSGIGKEEGKGGQAKTYLMPETTLVIDSSETFSKDQMQGAQDMNFETIKATKFYTTSNTVKTGADISSSYSILANVDTHEIIAGWDYDERVYPASLTKIMTILVAAENVDNLEDTFTMTDDIIIPLVNVQASRAGFKDGEKVKIIDLFYGAVLPSGADATVALADYVAGSEEEFIKLMNKKASELGLTNTHFCNTSGLHDKEHYTTLTEFAIILEYAMKNDLCRKLLSTYQYTTASTPQNPDGILLTSTMFSRMFGDEVPGVTIEGGKTGFTDEAGNCLATFAVKDGTEYLAITIKGSGQYAGIYDAINLYKNYL